MNKQDPKGNDLMNQMLDELFITGIECFNEGGKESELGLSLLTVDSDFLDDLLTEAEDLNISTT
jgi:hypothetical protein